MLVHASHKHIFMNTTIQLMVGIPLEMSHGSQRVAIVYAFGVIGGSLASSVFDPEFFLAGASGGKLHHSFLA